MPAVYIVQAVEADTHDADSRNNACLLCHRTPAFPVVLSLLFSPALSAPVLHVARVLGGVPVPKRARPLVVARCRSSFFFLEKRNTDEKHAYSERVDPTRKAPLTANYSRPAWPILG